MQGKDTSLKPSNEVKVADAGHGVTSRVSFIVLRKSIIRNL